MKVLALDGGGIRGLVSLYILKEIEALTGIPVQRHFDYFIGTSTGGIIACGLSYSEDGHVLRYTIDDLIRLFQNEYYTIFARGPLHEGRKFFKAKYGHGGLTRVLNQSFGSATLNACLPGKTILIPSYNATRNFPYYFSNNPHCRLNEMDLDFGDARIAHACLATTAAPTYFPTFLHQKPDGTKMGHRKFLGRRLILGE